MPQSMAVRGPSPPPLYDTSISTHEETSWHSSSYHSRDSGAARASPTAPLGSNPPAASSSAFRGWFPKSHPKSPRYDPRAYRRDEHHKPLHSEPIWTSSDVARSRGEAASAARSRRYAQQAFPDPEPNLQHLEREDQGGSSSGPLPVFTIDGIASEVALGGARTSSSSALTRDLLGRLDTRRTGHRQRRTGQSATGTSAPASRDALPPSSQSGAPCAVAGGGSEEATQKQRVRERVYAAAASRRNQQHQQDLSSSKSRGETAGRQPPPPPPSLPEEAGARPVTPAEAQGRTSTNDWHRRAEIETPEPARVVDLKQKLWDDHESLQRKSPVLRQHVALQYDREGLDQHWRQWHGEIEDDNEAAVNASPPRLGPKPAKRATYRPRSLSPGTLSARPRTPPPPMLPLTPASGYSTPKPAQVFQPRFVQAAHRASPAASQRQYSRSAREGPPAGASGAVAARSESSTNPSAAPPTFAAAATPDPKDRPGATVPLAKRAGQEPSRSVEAKDRSGTFAGKPSSSQPPLITISSDPKLGADATSASVAELVSKLQSVRRDNPGEALAQIDAIIRQSQANLSQGQQQELPPSRTPASAPSKVAAATASAIARKPIQGAAESGRPNRGGTATKDGVEPTRHRSSMESRSHPDDEPTLNETKHEAINERERGKEGEPDDDDESDDDETSVSSITNPTYGGPGAEHHHPRPTVLSTFRGAGHPRPSALTNYTNGRSTLRTTELQQPAHDRSRRRSRHRSPPPSSIHVSKDISGKSQSYQRLAEGEDSELDAVLRSSNAPTRSRPSVPAAEDDKTNTPIKSESDKQAVASGPTMTPARGPAKQKASEPGTDSRKEELGKAGLAEWSTLTTARTAPGEACPCPPDAPFNATLEMSAIGTSRSKEASEWVLDPSNSAELVQKIKKWDEMSEPDFCPAAGCLNSRSSDKDLHPSSPLGVDSFTDIICPRDGGAAASKRRHHPWDQSIPVCMGHVSVRETSMDHAAGVETEYSMKYQDAKSEASVSVEASTGGFRSDEKSEPVTKAKMDGASRGVPASKAARGNPSLAHEKLATSPGTLRDTEAGSSSHQAYARNLADDFDSAWVSLPSSSFFPGHLQEAVSAEENAKVLSLSKPGDGNVNFSRQAHRDEHYQTFRAKEESTKNEASASRGFENAKGDFKSAVGTTRTFQLGGSREGEKAGVEVAIVNDLQQKPAKSLHLSLPEANRGRRGLRNFLKLKQMGRTPSMSQESASTSSRSHLQSVTRDLQSASLDLEGAEAPPPPSRGRSQKDEGHSGSADRLRSRSLDERRIRNPHIAKKFSRLLRVYEDNPSKQFGII